MAQACICICISDTGGIHASPGADRRAGRVVGGVNLLTCGVAGEPAEMASGVRRHADRVGTATPHPIADAALRLRHAVGPRRATPDPIAVAALRLRLAVGPGRATPDPIAVAALRLRLAVGLYQQPT